jgi:hypothetical protein
MRPVTASHFLLRSTLETSPDAAAKHGDFGEAGSVHGVGSIHVVGLRSTPHGFDVRHGIWTLRPFPTCGFFKYFKRAPSDCPPRGWLGTPETFHDVGSIHEV